MASRGNIDLQELSKHFGSPEKDVAQSLGMCLTSLKKICRQHGVNRWPYRKIKSLDKKLKKLEVAFSTAKDDPSLVYAWWRGDIESTYSGTSSGSQTPSVSSSVAPSELCSTASTPRMEHRRMSPSPACRVVCRSPSPSPDGDLHFPDADYDLLGVCNGDDMAHEEAFRPATPPPPSLVSAPHSVACVKQADCAGDGGTPSPEPELSDHDIIFMLASCAGSGGVEAEAEAQDGAGSVKVELTDTDIMAALAGCCALPCAAGASTSDGAFAMSTEHSFADDNDGCEADDDVLA